MSTQLDGEKLKAILAEIKKDPKNESAQTRFLEVVQPIVKVTVQRFPSASADDIAQEVRILLLKKLSFIADGYFAGQIKDPQNYLYTVSLNAATAYVKRESKHDEHLVPIDDVQVEPIASDPNSKKQAIIEMVRQDALRWVRIRFPERKDWVRAEKFVQAIMSGQRPSFKAAKLAKWSGQRQEPAKDMYSVVLAQIRKMLDEHMEELQG